MDGGVEQAGGVVLLDAMSEGDLDSLVREEAQRALGE